MHAGPWRHVRSPTVRPAAYPPACGAARRRRATGSPACWPCAPSPSPAPSARWSPPPPCLGPRVAGPGDAGRRSHADLGPVTGRPAVRRPHQHVVRDPGGHRAGRARRHHRQALRVREHASPASSEGGLAPGAYRTAFRVVSDDGHPVTGQLRFTLRLPATAAPSASAPAGSGSAGPPPSPTARRPPRRHARPSVVPGSAPAVSGRLHRPRARRGSRPTCCRSAGVLLLVVIGAGALLWDRQRH